MKKSIVLALVVIATFQAKAKNLVEAEQNIHSTSLLCVTDTGYYPMQDGSFAVISAKDIARRTSAGPLMKAVLEEVNLFRSSQISCDDIKKLKLAARMQFDFLNTHTSLKTEAMHKVADGTCRQDVTATVMVQSPHSVGSTAPLSALKLESKVTIKVACNAPEVTK